MKTLATVAMLLCSFFQMGVAIVLKPGQTQDLWSNGTNTIMIRCWSESNDTGLKVWREDPIGHGPGVIMSGNVCNPQELVAVIGTPGKEMIHYRNTGDSDITVHWDYYPAAEAVNTARAEPGDCVGLVVPANTAIGVNPIGTNTMLDWSVKTGKMSGNVTTLIMDAPYHAGVAFSSQTTDTLWVCAKTYAILFEYSITEGPLLAAGGDPDVRMETYMRSGDEQLHE